MSKIYLNINGREVHAYQGQTILEAARDNGIEIPTLCHDERVKTYGACGVCVVEAEGSPRLLRACSTQATDGMMIQTDTERVRNTRRSALELLLSDHRGDCVAPCVRACPGKTDCQGYVGLIANGEYREALKLVKAQLPLPASIGRVCPHPCETACRRQLVEEPINIAQLKRLIGDLDLEANDTYLPEMAQPSGQKVAIVGGGPGGLTAAYFLKTKGHDVTVYDAMPKMGGMLRYGIPEYRLPKQVLDEEITVMEDMGITMVNGMRIGRDMTLAHLRETYDAVIVAVGAWRSMGLRCPGEELEGVLGGIDFLRDVALRKAPDIGRSVAIVGGGNTAMDACRTAVRLGAKAVYNIYRRTRDEMPAEDIEIDEAIEEGVDFQFLTNPIEVLGENGRVTALRLQKMQLGEPDASGRRAPVPIPGAETTLTVDTVIMAIGQKLEPAGLEELTLTKGGTIAADENTFRTSVEGVFAVGDATNKGADIAIAAIGEAKRCADIVNAYLHGTSVAYVEPYVVTKEVTAADLAGRKKEPRRSMHHLPAQERKHNFAEVLPAYTKEEAVAEAKRCLECGCADYFECKLVAYANEYTVKPEKFDGEAHKRPMDVSNPFMYRNMEKCILCGLCVRVCDEVMGRTALGLTSRGFDTVVAPELGLPLLETDCISCGQCVTLCPTGALGERLPITKGVPFAEEKTESVCSYCSVGCKTTVATKGDMVVRSLPSGSDALLCVKGRFGPGRNPHPLQKPLVRKNGRLTETSFTEAWEVIAQRTMSIAAQGGQVAVSISDKFTNEELRLMQAFAQTGLHVRHIFCFNRPESGLEAVLGRDCATLGLTELRRLTRGDAVLLVAEDVTYSHTIAGIAVKQAAENGAALINLRPKANQADEWAQHRLAASKRLETIRQFAKAVADLCPEPARADGYAAWKEKLAGVAVPEDVQKAAEAFVKAKRAAIVFTDNVSAEAAEALAAIALLAGQLGKARAGLLPLKANNNSQGLANLGIAPGAAGVRALQNREVQGLIVFGENVPEADLSGVSFLAVMDTFLTDTAERADVVLPAAPSYCTDGTYTSTTGQIQWVCAALPPAAGKTNEEILAGLFAAQGIQPPLPGEPVELPLPPYRNGYATENGNAQLYAHIWDTDPLLFMDRENTNATYSRFLQYLDSHGAARRA